MLKLAVAFCVGSRIGDAPEPRLAREDAPGRDPYEESDSLPEK